jgi:hypothetical protein
MGDGGVEIGGADNMLTSNTSTMLYQRAITHSVFVRVEKLKVL